MMDLRTIADAVADTVNPNTPVTIQASTGYTIGAGLKQVPSYGAPVTGFAQVQELNSSELRWTDGLNIQGVMKTIYLRGALNAVVRANSQGGDLVTIGSQTWLTVKTMEQWPLWSKCLIVLQVAA